MSKLSFLFETIDGIFCSHSSCNVCPLAKHTRLPFPHENNRCNEPFALIMLIFGVIFLLLHSLVLDIF